MPLRKVRSSRKHTEEKRSKQDAGSSKPTSAPELRILRQPRSRFEQRVVNHPSLRSDAGRVHCGVTRVPPLTSSDSEYSTFFVYTDRSASDPEVRELQTWTKAVVADLAQEAGIPESPVVIATIDSVNWEHKPGRTESRSGAVAVSDALDVSDAHAELSDVTSSIPGATLSQLQQLAKRLVELEAALMGDGATGLDRPTVKSLKAQV